MKIKKGKLSIESSGLTKYTPSQDMLNKVGECDYMGIILLCRLGKFDEMYKFIPIDLPPTYINYPDTRYKTETSDQETTEYYFVDEEYNTFSPIYQSSWVGIMEGVDFKEKNYWDLLSKLKTQTYICQDHNRISYGDITIIPFDIPKPFEFRDSIETGDEYDKQLLDFVVTVTSSHIRVFDIYSWYVDKGEISWELEGIPESEIRPSRRILESCLQRYNDILSQLNVKFTYTVTFNDMI